MSSIAQRWGLNPEAPKTASEQYAVMQTRFSPPAAHDDRYLQIHDMPWHDGSIHRQICGVHLIVDGQREPWRSLHDEAKIDGSKPQLAVSHVDIFCDTLEVVGRLCLPQARVRIFARRLVFADLPEAVLSTSANPWLVPDASAAKDGDSKGADGLPGRPGGDFEIYVSSVEAAQGRPRLLAAGCAGQNAGAGRNGNAGSSVDGIRHVHDEFTASFGVGTQGVDFNFDPPAVFFTFRWGVSPPSSWCGGLGSDMEYGKRDNWPSNGTDAIRPGKPGDASDGGSLVTNHKAVAALFEAPRGAAGRKAQDARGGAHGNPKISTRHHVVGNMAATGWFSKAAQLDYQEKERREVHNGKDAHAPEATRPEGLAGTAKVIQSEDDFCWLSAEALQPLLQHLRDLMFSGYPERAQALLQSYEPALRQAGPEAGDLDVLAWARAETEELSLRLSSHFDYFGHPAGYTPGYSLGTTMGIHQADIDLLMGQLLLATRLEASQRQAKGMGGMMAELQAMTQSQLEASAETLTKAQQQALAVRERIEKEIQPAIAKIQVEMQSLESRMRVETHGKLELEHFWRGSIKIAGAVSQLIPVGQPALGKVGNIAALVSDKFRGSDDGDVASLIEPTIKILGEASDVCTLYADAAPTDAGKAKPAEPSGGSNSKQSAKSQTQDVRREPRRKSLFTIEEQEEGRPISGRIIVDELSGGEFKTIVSRDFKKAIKTPEPGKAPDEDKGTDWTRLIATGKGLAPVLKKFQAAASEFKVPAQEVDAYLDKLKSESAEWKALAEKIKDFNKKKADCLLEIEGLGLKIGACREVITSGAALYFRVRQDAVQNGREISPAVQALSRVIRHRAERSLLRSLYLMVKAHEALLLQTPKDIDWRLDQIADKALKLADSQGGSPATFGEQRQQLVDLFRSNIAAFRDSLIQLHEPGRTLSRQAKLVLTADSDRDAALLVALNAGEKVRINPLDYGLIKADEHRARLAKITLVNFAFENDAASTPGAGGALHQRSMDLYMELAPEGAIRRGKDIFWFRSDRSANWSWSCWEKRNPGRSTCPWEIKASLPSLVDADVLEFLIGKVPAAGSLNERRERARAALSMPPLWSAMDLWVAFSEDGGGNVAAPRLKRLEFVIEYESDNSADTEVTLLVRSRGAPTGALLGCTPDLAGRGDGYADGMLRIYRKSTSLTPGAVARLVAPERIGEMQFAGWTLQERGCDPQKITDQELSLSMRAHTQVLCEWERAAQPVLRSARPGRLQSLRASADPDAALLGVVGVDEPGTSLECLESGWRLMQFGKARGWVEPT